MYLQFSQERWNLYNIVRNKETERIESEVKNKFGKVSS